MQVMFLSGVARNFQTRNMSVVVFPDPVGPVTRTNSIRFVNETLKRSEIVRTESQFFEIHE